MFLFVLDRVYISVKDVFVFYGAPLTEVEVQRSLFVSGGCDMVYTKRWRRTVRNIGIESSW